MTAPPTDRSPWANRWIIAVGVLLASLMELIDGSIVNVGLDQMSQHLGASITDITWVSTGYILSAVVVIPMTGWLSAYFGRRRYLTGSIMLFTVASVLCGQSSSLLELVLFRILQGIGGGALVATAQAVMFETFPPAQRAVAQGLFGIGMMVGPAIGPTLGGLILDRYSWPWMFYINVPIGVVASLITWRFVRAPADERRPPRVDVMGIVLITVGIGALQYVLERGQASGWLASNTIVALALLSVGSIVTLVLHELRTPTPILDLRVLRNRSLAAGSVVGMALGVALFGSVFALPLYLQQVLGYDALTAGEIMFPGALGSAAALALASTVGTRLPDLRWFILLGIAALVTSMLLHAEFTVSTSREQLFWPVVLRGFGTGCMFVPLSLSSLQGLTGASLPQGTAIYNLSRQIGGSAGIALLTTLLARSTATSTGRLAEHLSSYDPLAQQRLETLSLALRRQSVDSLSAAARALALLQDEVRQQASLLAFRDVFRAVAMIVLAVVPLWFLLRPVRRITGESRDPS